MVGLDHKLQVARIRVGAASDDWFLQDSDRSHQLVEVFFYLLLILIFLSILLEHEHIGLVSCLINVEEAAELRHFTESEKGNEESLFKTWRNRIFFACGDLKPCNTRKVCITS